MITGDPVRAAGQMKIAHDYAYPPEGGTLVPRAVVEDLMPELAMTPTQFDMVYGPAVEFYSDMSWHARLLRRLFGRFT